MSDSQMVDAQAALSAALGLFTAGLDVLLEADFSASASAELVRFAQEWEVQQRRAVAVTHALVVGLDQTGAPGEFGYRDTAALLADLLRLSPTQARARSRAADELGARRSLLGEVLPPQFEYVAGAQRAGVISPAHASVIIKALDTLTPDADIAHARRGESELVAHAAELDPKRLGSVATRLLAYLNPDGRQPVEAEQQRRRSLTLGQAADGSGVLNGHLTPELLAVLQTVLEPLSAPVPAADGAADPRTAGQRAHDGLLDLCQRALRTGDLPPSGGVPTTLVLTITEAEYRARTGFAVTPFGGLIPAADAARLSDEADVVTVALTATGGILDYGRQRRTASPGQRLTLYARDRGCTFPSCTAPPTRCQAHHVTEWQQFGPTKVDNLVLLCGHHHRTFEQQGWSVAMHDGVPWWTPPPHLDRHQVPRQNHYWQLPDPENAR